jgi:hypothetical protein
MASTGSSFSVAATDTATAKANLVVGLLSHDDAETTAAVAAVVREGITSQFGDLSNRLAFVGGGSVDDAAARVREAVGDGVFLDLSRPSPTADLLEVPYHGIPGKARALQAILTAARNLDARACVVFDGGVHTVTPQWLDWLVRPVIDHAFDFVTPYYERHPFEGALTKGVVYPLIRSLYGVRLRQPAAAEFACSSRFVGYLLDEDIWERDGAQVGIDLWLSTAAACGDFRLGEAALGTRGHRGRGENTLDLGATVTQVVGSLFADLEDRAERWQRIRGSVPIQQFGSVPPASPPRHGASVDPERLIESFRLGCRELRDIWTWVLPPRTVLDLQKLADRSTAQFRLDDELWARLVYDFALGFRLRVLARDHLLKSLVPLYLGWLASFVLEARNLGAQAVEQRIESLAEAFEAQKPYLIARWRWPERLRT